MTQIVVNDEQAKQIATADGPVQVVDRQGTLVGVCTPVRFPHSPYSREEIERRREEMRKHPEKGKPLSEIMARLHQLKPTGN